ncbi:MAG: hypothetical protein A3A98_03890 [Candidatus Staskawiczbacteria bacterium RIFCSPLOWO2_01_FULL_40_39]|uniref:Carbon storage regulator n=1 Tax=Candidatus Staskawiczbacteria bacterium RIFCSPHIGHO2_01_FULL_39_25 TaxID=1802202 RepID=A0A1G2HNN3_9BACT|nr:MAG: hypothetical protein A2730_03105 [Candidatus Staskawiczbacteria bacterium RIFCSPHIGHO2_01_FULL_39_25]OGZ73912.1 MAG: hypothetical protein A3A98_03890 [Candidatus Staskawiczbacteria bacterium RIFCSPLOWO2_01_FULL_40_39]OGZ76227.1 MAG: hypothetical protein A3I87_00110 [Candidatus Staskawiczbacteria bacterium RIFCSPLOWO2_02_FULL_39_8]
MKIVELRKGESVYIGKNIRIMPTQIRAGWAVRLGIEAPNKGPNKVIIHRQEVFEEMHRKPMPKESEINKI